MRLKGVNVRKSNTITFRNGNPEIDKDLRGNPVESNYIAFVKKKDCNVIEEDDKDYLDVKNTPSIPVAYGATYYAYGESKIVKGTKCIDGITYKSYYKTPFYILYNGDVYVGSVYKGVEKY